MMAEGHDHASAAAGRHAGARHRRRLLAATCLIGGFFVVELVGGLATNSLALLSDAGHMFTDVLGLGMALAAIQAATATSTNRQRTFGLYRLEILAALANAALLFGVAVWIIWEAVLRFADPPEVLGAPMLVVAVLGLAVNLVAFRLLRDGADESLNVEGAYLEVLADTLGSIGVIVAAVVIQLTGFARIDAIFGVAIGLFVLPRTWRLGRRSLRILTQAAPEHVDVEDLRASLLDLDHVLEAHDLHVWTLTSGMEVASAHVVVSEDASAHVVLDTARRVMRERFGIDHATVQVEPAAHADCGDCTELSW
jgi:cobalt-zinc-cadmium efflux system protein